MSRAFERPQSGSEIGGRGLASFLGFICSLALLLPGGPSRAGQVPSGKDVVSPNVYVSFDPAGRGTSAQIAVAMKIRPGFHVNAHEKSADYLIATELKSETPAGFTAGAVAYPKGKLEQFKF